jgi:hypothetical protein
MRTFEFKLQYDEEKLMKNLKLRLDSWEDVIAEVIVGVFGIILLTALAFAYNVFMGIVSLAIVIISFCRIARKEIIFIIDGVEVKDEYKFS